MTRRSARSGTGRCPRIRSKWNAWPSCRRRAAWRSAGSSWISSMNTHGITATGRPGSARRHMRPTSTESSGTKSYPMNSKMRASRMCIWNAAFKKEEDPLHRVLLFLCDFLQVLPDCIKVVECVADDVAVFLTAYAGKCAPRLILHPYFRTGADVVAEFRRQVWVPPLILIRPCVTQHEVVEFLRGAQEFEVSEVRVHIDDAIQTVREDLALHLPGAVGEDVGLHIERFRLDEAGDVHDLFCIPSLIEVAEVADVDLVPVECHIVLLIAVVFRGGRRMPFDDGFSPDHLFEIVVEAVDHRFELQFICKHQLCGEQERDDLGHVEQVVIEVFLVVRCGVLLHLLDVLLRIEGGLPDIVLYIPVQGIREFGDPPDVPALPEDFVGKHMGCRPEGPGIDFPVFVYIELLHRTLHEQTDVLAAGERGRGVYLPAAGEDRTS